TVRRSHCAGPTGEATRAATSQMRTHSTDGAYRMHRKVIGGACGMPKRATMKPVLQISTNSQGIARSSLLPSSSVRKLSRLGANLGQRLLQVIDHRPDGQHRGDPDQRVAPAAGVDGAEQQAVEQQE